MLFLLPIISIISLLAILYRDKLANKPTKQHYYSYKTISFLLGCILETEILLQLHIQIFFSMSDNVHLSSAAWDKLVPDNSTTSALMHYHLHWKPYILRKIHDRTEEPGTLDILLLPEPDAGWTPAQILLIAAANLARSAFPAPPNPAANALELSRYASDIAFYKLLYERFKRLDDAKKDLKDKLLGALDQTTLDHILPDRAQYNVITIGPLYILVDNHFQRVNPGHLLAIEADLKSPFVFVNPNSMDDHVAKHVHLNNGLVAALRTRSEVDKIADLRYSFATSPHANILMAFVNIYDASHLTLESQSFPDFHQVCNAALPTLLENLAATTASSNFGANGALTKPHPGKAPVKRPLASRPAAYC